MKIRIYYFGKPRDPHANAIAEDYLRRASHYAKAEMTELRSRAADPWAKHPSAQIVALDPAGKPADSLTTLIERSERDARDLVFLIGGADGLPAPWRTRAASLLSLSPMTYPHELARAMLTEQIYRAFTTLRGHPYPR